MLFGADIGSEIQDETRDGTFQLLLLRTRVSLSSPLLLLLLLLSFVERKSGRRRRRRKMSGQARAASINPQITAFRGLVKPDARARTLVCSRAIIYLINEPCFLSLSP